MFSQALVAAMLVVGTADERHKHHAVMLVSLVATVAYDWHITFPQLSSVV